MLVVFCLFGCLSELGLNGLTMIELVLSVLFPDGLRDGNQKRAPPSRWERQTVGSGPFLVGLEGARRVLEIGALW
jgi:hypothetical protein